MGRTLKFVKHIIVCRICVDGTLIGLSNDWNLGKVLISILVHMLNQHFYWNTFDHIPSIIFHSEFKSNNLKSFKKMGWVNL